MRSRAAATGVRKTKGILQVASRVSASIGIEFLRSIALRLAEALPADAVYLGEFVGGHVERVKTLVAAIDGQIGRVPDYPLAGSASVALALGEPASCRLGAREKFPNDELLSNLQAEAFVGLPLIAANGASLGVILALYRSPIHSCKVPQSLLEIFAPRAAAEIERKQSEERLRESEQRHLAFISTNPDAMWRIEFDYPIPVNLPQREQVQRIHQQGYIAECNDALARFLGRQRAAELIGCRLADLRHLISDPSVQKATQALVQSGYRLITVETHPVDQNSIRHTMLRSQWGIVEDEYLQRVWGTSRDITELRNSQFALDASEQRMADLLETMQLIVAVLDLDGAIAFCNDYLIRLTGWNSAEIKGKNWFDLMVPAEERDVLRAKFESAKEDPSKPFHFEGSLLGAGNRRWWISWDYLFIRDSGGRIAAVVNMGRDITEHKELEAQFRQAQKLESIGRLASGVAHDFNNLLTIIIGYSGAVLAKGDLTEAAQISLTEIKKAAEKGADLAHQLLSFSSRQVSRPALLNLNTVIADNQRMLRRLIGDDVELLTSLDPLLGTVRADPTQIHQVLLNLAVNARDAMPRGGRLTISSSNVDINGEKRPHLPWLPQGRYVLLTVVDNGIGMSGDVRAHLFEPFFTTKPPGRGTGLGLYTVYKIIRQIGGHISADSELKKGTTFSLFLPRVESPSSDPEVLVQAPVKGGTETILLVEDQNEVRALAAKILRELGYTVLEAETAGRALEVFQTYTSPIHLLLTDIVMPMMGGVELADRVKPVQPQLKVIFMSGYGDSELNGEGLPQNLLRIHKPFTPEVLAQKVREILDEA
jgi:PAS domain S-box-containing protein